MRVYRRMIKIPAECIEHSSTDELMQKAKQIAEKEFAKLKDILKVV